ncbi:ATP-binding protein [Nitrosovibrio sp. Nv6]|uniref:ATP-binding protein n=1 Tax=Nitrosovibrio sp. Nv6 TaxID=1855340 RepID=UPI0008AF28A6|nr:ATP-binding protein [Nitrosovibrio sp. Nv6]SEP19429.1 Histidine kinase-, DNA gyrase B-, and HSP90-like ATPase [Nitrosovibrio sp. Nv6]
MSPEFDIANPGAVELFESLRAFGYDLPTALADIVDNSITARARNIWIDLNWKGADSRIIIRDDGDGMTEMGLVQAMRPGSLGPLAERSANDLGRFGLGMKTASISQCRCLTVMSKATSSTTVVRRWDLDYIASTGTGEWRLLKGIDLLPPTDHEVLADQATGTVLFWDRLDQLVGDASLDDEVAQRHFRERADAVKLHLAMVFHRFLRGRNSIRIHLNGRPIEPWDPFLEDADAVDPMPSETLVFGNEEVVVKPFILPHHSKLSAERHALAAGPKGWNAHQGFYIYRNRRLLVAGDWLGLGMQKEEHYKLARIRVDLGNSSDLIWQIDVKKSRARPPTVLHKDLQRLARAARGRAAKIYRHRGKVLQRQHGDNQVFLWTHLVRHGKTFYKVNRDHPLVRKVLGDTGDKAAVRALLNLVEQAVPTPLIVINNAEAPNAFGGPFEDSPSDLRQAMEAVFFAMVDQGRNRADAARALAGMEPFNHFPEQLAGFLDEVARRESEIQELMKRR